MGRGQRIEAGAAWPLPAGQQAAATWAPAGHFPLPEMVPMQFMTSRLLVQTQASVASSSSAGCSARGAAASASATPDAMLAPGFWAAFGSLLGGFLFVLGGKQSKIIGTVCARALWGPSVKAPRLRHWSRRRRVSAAGVRRRRRCTRLPCCCPLIRRRPPVPAFPRSARIEPAPPAHGSDEGR